MLRGKAAVAFSLTKAGRTRISSASSTPIGRPPGGGAAIRWPAAPDTNAELKNRYPQRNVSDAGQVFFESTESLVLADRNGQRDVYQYEAGSPHLVSSGTSEAPSYFMDATPSGSDVFF